MQTALHSQAFLHGSFHERAFCKWVFRYHFRSLHELFGNIEHTSACPTGPVSFILTDFTGFPFSNTVPDILNHLVLPKIIGNPIWHRKDYAIQFEADNIRYCIWDWCIRAIRTKLAWAVKPMPLFGGFVNDSLVFGTEDQDLRIP